jgi:hypothetical protein
MTHENDVFGRRGSLILLATVMLMLMGLAALGVGCSPQENPPPNQVTRSETESQGIPEPTRTSNPTTAVENPAPSLTVSETSVPATPTPTLGPTSSPVTLDTTVSPTRSPDRRDWSFRIAYTLFDRTDHGWVGEIWIAEPPFETARLLVDPDPKDGWIGSPISWSRDGQRLAYVHLDGESRAVSIVNVDSLETQTFRLSIPIEEPSGPETYAAPELRSWSKDDRWLAFDVRFQRSVEAGEEFKTVFLDTTSGELEELPERIFFQGWSLADPDEFLYILHPTYPVRGDESVHIGRVGTSDPVASITDLGQYAPARGFAVLSPDGSRAVLGTSGPHGGSYYHLLLDFDENTWHLLPGVKGSPFTWSPAGDWVAFSAEHDLWFLNISNRSVPPIRVIPESDYAVPLAWVPDQAVCIYRDGNRLYAVDLSVPDEPFLLLDLAPFGGSDEQPLLVKVSVESSP